jgi:bifunctional non-homologous end joining protein LigD
LKSPLAPYASKRRFDRTPEPAPKLAERRSGPLLFVIQQHAARRLHYDFRLELDGVLKSWAVPKGPSLDPADKRLAVAVEDHPFDYASFEGVIPAGQYGAGSVIVWDCGVYSPDEDGRYDFDDPHAAQQRVRAGLAAGKLSVLLRGQKLKGSFALVRTSGEAQWLLLKHRDRFAGATVPAAERSVLSAATLQSVGPEVASRRLSAEQLTLHGPLESAPRQLAPMLAETGETLRSDPRWAYEPKLDGYRVIAPGAGRSATGVAPRPRAGAVLSRDRRRARAAGSRADDPRWRDRRLRRGCSTLVQSAAAARAAQGAGADRACAAR